MAEDRKSFGVLQYVHAALFSLNLALVLVAVFFLFAPHSMSNHLYGMDVVFSRFFHLLPSRTSGVLLKDTITGGYFEFLVPGIVLAFCLSILLRFFSRTTVCRNILGLPAGIAAVSLAPAWLLSAYLHAQGWGGLETVMFCEILAVTVCVVLYWQNRSSIPWAGSLIVLGLHYPFWFWQFHPFFVALLHGWGGAVGVAPIIGLLSTLAWIVYLDNIDSKSERAESLIST